MKISEAVFRIIDIETTGLDHTKGDRIVEFACADLQGNEFQMLVNPGIPIPYEMSAIHHITDIDVENAISYDMAMLEIEKKIIPTDIVVAHNAEFDKSFLDFIKNRRWLCSKRLAQHLFPEISRHSNQVLRYYLGGAEIDMHGYSPHRALADVIVTRFVFKKALEKYLADSRDDDIDSLLLFADRPIRMQRVPFGKYKGQLFKDCPIDYIQWALSTRGMSNMDKDLRHTFECEIKDRGFY